MKLQAYLKASSKTQAAFAGEIGVVQQVVSKWCSGTNVPNRRSMELIVKATGGAVQANDFYQTDEDTRALREAGAREGGEAGRAGAGGNDGDQVSPTAGLSDSQIEEGVPV